MGRHSSSGSYGHSIRRFGPGHYRLSWTVDRYCRGSRLRFPTSTSRDTDARGAVRFSLKWGCDMPAVEGEAV
jgi:hypothetical protein